MKTERLTAEEIRIKCRLILVDYHRRDDYDLTMAENDMIAVVQAFAAQEVESEIEKRMPSELRVAFGAGRDYQKGLTNEYHGGPENESPDFAEWFRSRMKGGDKQNDKITCQCPPELQEWSRERGCYYCTNCDKDI